METTQIGPAGNFKIIIIVILNVVSMISTHMSNVIKTTPASTRVQVQKETENGMEDGICGEVAHYYDYTLSMSVMVMVMVMVMVVVKLMNS